MTKAAVRVRRPVRRPRLLDVAMAAGVSLGAASKALSAPDAVRPKTLAAVQNAVAKLGYIPSDAGRALASRSTRMIGVVLPTISNPAMALFVHELQKVLGDSDYQLLTLTHEYDRFQESQLIERLIRRSVDALILIGCDQNRRIIRMLDKRALPYLFSWSSEDAPEFGALRIPNHSAMVQVIKHLAALKHRRIAMIGGDPEHNERARWRLKGVRDAAAKRRMELVDVVTVPLTIAGGREGFRQLDPLRRHITAIVCGTDPVAAGVLHEAQLAGIAVPGQISITGFDDIEMVSLLSPPLTSIHVPIADLAAKTGQSIIAMLQGQAPPRSITLPTPLIVRGSTGSAAPPGHPTVTSLVSR